MCAGGRWRRCEQGVMTMIESMIFAVSAAPGIATEALSAPTTDAFSPVEMFMKASLVVQAVMVILMLASVWSWTVVIAKQGMFGRLRREAREFEDRFWAGRSLEELASTIGDRPKDAMGRVFAAAMREWRESRARGTARDSAGVLSLTDRLDRVMTLVVRREVASAENGLGILASIGSSAVFIGLFGTVWGIFDTFNLIGVSENANFAVVAPGMAEALFATALGLFAAVPAVIFYNKFATELAKFEAQLDGYADELFAILSRTAQERA